MSHIQLYEMDDMNYGQENSRQASASKFSKRQRPTHGRRRGKAPQSFNGIHRRRTRKMTW